MSRTKTASARRAHLDAVRDMMRSGMTSRSLLLGRIGVSPHGLKHLRETARPTRASDRGQA